MSSSTFGALLAELRQARPGRTQARLAALAGLDHSHVSRLEAGKRQPTRESARRLADALGCAPTERARLFLALGDVPEPEDDPRIVRELRAALARLPPDRGTMLAWAVDSLILAATRGVEGDDR